MVFLPACWKNSGWHPWIRNAGASEVFSWPRSNTLISNEWARQRAKKRGGRRYLLPLDGERAETRHRLEPVDDRSPAQVYEGQWALTVLEQVATELRQDYAARGKSSQFDALKSHLNLGSPQQSYAQLAERLNISEGTARVMVHRLKQQCRGILRRQIAQTVASAAEVESKIQHLFQALAKQERSQIPRNNFADSRQME